MFYSPPRWPDSISLMWLTWGKQDTRLASNGRQTQRLCSTAINVLAQCQFEKVIASFFRDSFGHNSDHRFKVNENVKTVNRSLIENHLMQRFFSSNIHYASRDTGTIDSTLIYIPSTDWKTSYRSRDIIALIFEIRFVYFVTENNRSHLTKTHHLSDLSRLHPLVRLTQVLLTRSGSNLMLSC